MKSAAPKVSAEETQFRALAKEFESFIKRLKRRWLRKNNNPPRAHVLYELDAEERARADAVIRRWEQYVTPVAEAWWKRRGYGIRWPKKSSEPCRYYKLETAPT